MIQIAAGHRDKVCLSHLYLVDTVFGDLKNFRLIVGVMG